ncbi:hypothetical protein HWV62_22854 [Athelia sp. TMB]|nr:hypothetical protein HWV62_41759 [Athelia sp. TMB]KAF7983243.1 hypothetical protein HWV62_22854 [Athelia sp. TMB]
MFLLPTLFFIGCSVSTVLAGNLTKGENCSIGENRLQIGNYEFFDMCDTHTFCNGTSGTCDVKGCRKDQWPYGYNSSYANPPPPLCTSGQFCPDEEDACQPQLEVGSPCQLNRDDPVHDLAPDECAPPPNWKQLADQTPYGLNKNGSVCLNGQCMWANVTAGSTCVVENTPYIGYASNTEFIYIVSRHNCMNGFYCDSSQLVCVKTNLEGQSCGSDKECATFNCLESGVCGKGPQEPNHVAIYVYILVALGILGGMLATFVTLFIFHRRQRDALREQRAQYWREQSAFRQDLDNMRQSARISIMSMSQKGGGGGSNRSTVYSTRSTMYEDGGPEPSGSTNAPPTPSSASMLLVPHTATRASGLRQQFTGDADDDDEEEFSSQEERR